MGCPILDDAIVAGVLGSSVESHVTTNIVPGFDSCDFVDSAGTDFGITRQSGAFGPADAAGAAALAVKYIPQLPDEARAQIDTLSQIGIKIAVPGYQLTPVDGVGDAALWVKTELVPGSFKDSLLVQHGTDAFAFDTDDSPEAQSKLTALAQAVLSSQ